MKKAIQFTYVLSVCAVILTVGIPAFGQEDQGEPEEQEKAEKQEMFEVEVIIVTAEKTGGEHPRGADDDERIQ